MLWLLKLKITFGPVSQTLGSRKLSRPTAFESWDNNCTGKITIERFYYCQRTDSVTDLWGSSVQFGSFRFGLVWFPIAIPIPDPMKVRVGCCPLGFLFKVLANESFLSIDAAGHYVWLTKRRANLGLL